MRSNTMHFSDYLQSMLTTHRSKSTTTTGTSCAEDSYGYAYYGSKTKKSKREKWRPLSGDSSVASERSRRRRVHFAPIDSNSYIVPNTTSGSSEGTIVSSLPCTNETGTSGRYYGRVNDRMQPHGSGALIYRDGSAQTAIWSNGTPVEPWIPTAQAKEQQRRLAKHTVREQTQQQVAREQKEQLKQANSMLQQESRQRESRHESRHESSRKHEPSPKRSKSKKRRRNSKQKLRESTDHTMSTRTMSTRDMSSSSLQLHDTYLPHLEIGDAPTKYDVLESDPRKINLLQKHDFCWILRSGGTKWSYAIIAEIEDTMMRFVVDCGGSTKVLSRKHWATSIRLVSPPRKSVEELVEAKLTRGQQKQQRHHQSSSSNPMASKALLSRSFTKETTSSKQRSPWPLPFCRVKQGMSSTVKPALATSKKRLPMNMYMTSPPITEEEQRKMATSSATLHRSYHGSGGVEPWMDQSDPDMGGGLLYAHDE